MNWMSLKKGNMERWMWLGPRCIGAQKSEPTLCWWPKNLPPNKEKKQTLVSNVQDWILIVASETGHPCSCCMSYNIKQMAFKKRKMDRCMWLSPQCTDAQIPGQPYVDGLETYHHRWPKCIQLKYHMYTAESSLWGQILGIIVPNAWATTPNRAPK